MSEIKNIHLITEGYPDHLSQKDLHMMEQAAIAHRKLANIEFKILEYNDRRIVFRVTQGKNQAENYQTAQRLVEIVHETFDRFFQNHKVIVRPFPFVESPANQIDAEWVRKQMLKYGTRVKDISLQTGIERTSISSIVNSNRPLSQPMRAMFWFYFLAKEQASIRGTERN